MLIVWWRHRNLCAGQGVDAAPVPVGFKLQVQASGSGSRVIAMTVLKVNHLTVYRYAKPVRLGDHRLMFRPRDSHDMRLLDTRLVISPPAKKIRWMHDVFGNSIAICSFDRT